MESLLQINPRPGSTNLFCLHHPGDPQEKGMSGIGRAGVLSYLPLRTVNVHKQCAYVIDFDGFDSEQSDHILL